MKNLLKKQIDWLWSAIRDRDGWQIVTITDDCALATDGIRMHAINADFVPDTIDGASVGNALEAFSDAPVKAQFAVNPEFLIDALRVFNGSVDIHYVQSENNGIKGVIINSNESDCEVFLMCVEKVDNE
jgi:hypothetical protein